MRLMKACCVSVVVALLGGVSLADELAEVARGVAEKHASAVVTLRLTVKQSFSGPAMGTDEDEQVIEALGTVVDPQGLTVLPLSSTDPTEGMMEQFAAEMGEEEPGFKFDVRITSVKLLLYDGKEMPAEVILRDKDLDLAVARPKEAPEQPLPFIELKSGASARPFDPVIVLDRLGSVGSRANAGHIERITASVTKPRPFWVVYGALGCPAFTTSGELLGIITQRFPRHGDQVGVNWFSPYPFELALPIVLPVSDVAEVVEQARTSPEPETADENEAAPETEGTVELPNQNSGPGDSR